MGGGSDLKNIWDCSCGIHCRCSYGVPNSKAGGGGGWGRGGNWWRKKGERAFFLHVGNNGKRDKTRANYDIIEASATNSLYWPDFLGNTKNGKL